ncbi:Predicted nucleotidyltransferase [Marinobacter persicus]|uniref:Predicted nucleotidyltransferase n=1 Tax=Marinobacter persicus TaxID=930118 RepID=A0A1I3PI29_9GAMM|nr:nucleotidyltransferase domain-containing protein [Marinobacter persicus]GHD54624.1 DNA polymerase [Marinobacter persicus]SFJ21061.1 Predicted nucleotidyltransferase [Marinobacter persicus]
MTSPASEPTDRFGLPSYVLESLKKIFQRHTRIEHATVYGSRAKGNYRYNSDIDIMLTAPDLPWQEFIQMEMEIDDLLLPWKVDLALKHHVENPDLLDHVGRVGVPIY